MAAQPVTRTAKPAQLNTPPAVNEAATAASAPAQSARRGRKPGTKMVRKDLSGVTMDMLSGFKMMDKAAARAVIPSRARTEVQVKVDKDVRTAWDAWVAEGRPEKWTEIPPGFYVVAPDQAENVKYLLARSASYLNLRVRLGSPARDADGNEIVAFYVTDKREADTVKDVKDAATSSE